MMDPSPHRTTGTDGNYVEAAKGVALTSRRQEIARRIHDVSELHIVDRLDGVHEGFLLPRPHLHEDNNPLFQGHDVDLAQGAQEILFNDAVAPETEVPSRCTFTTFTGEEVRGFAL